MPTGAKPATAADFHDRGHHGAVGTAAVIGTSTGGAFEKPGGDDEKKAADAEKLRERGWVAPVPYDYEAFQARGGSDWDSNVRVYEWDGEHGDVGPELPELELDLFGLPDDRISAGIDFSK